MVLDPADPNARSVGSFFMNPVVAASEFDGLAARIIADGVALAREVRDGVRDRFGISLHPEPLFVGISLG